MIILLHSSKSMRTAQHNVLSANIPRSKPKLLTNAIEIIDYLKNLDAREIALRMHISEALAKKTVDIIHDWKPTGTMCQPAVNSFIGDIYSGLRAYTFDQSDSTYAQKHLRILSGLYGILRPYDCIMPYRLEMAYTFNNPSLKNMCKYWGSAIAQQIPKDEIIVNTSSQEYMKTIYPYVEAKNIMSPQFYTLNQKTEKPTFVAVHSKIARGAYARWIIKKKITSTDELKLFNDLGYAYNKSLSTNNNPAFVCEQFGGVGLSMRLT